MASNACSYSGVLFSSPTAGIKIHRISRAGHTASDHARNPNNAGYRHVSPRLFSYWALGISAYTV